MQPVLATVKLSEIVFDEGLYPRVDGHDPEKVKDYVRDMESIEAAGKFISINATNVLIDGRHRQLAYRIINDDNGEVEIQVYQYPVVSPLETFKLGCELQERGKSLSNRDRMDGAKKMYALGESSQKEIGLSLGVSQQTVSSWLSRTLKEEKGRKREKAFSMWLSCHTHEEISEETGVTRQTIDNWVDEYAKLLEPGNFAYLSESENASARHTVDFERPIYNIWKQQDKTTGSAHNGNSEVRWVDNLLYLYTEPFDVVVDPFGGGGSTIDLCKKRFRRYWVSDRKPIIERETEIRQWDITEGLPPLHRWHDVKLVYLDPPYWKQAEGFYSDDPTDLANMTLEDFHGYLENLILNVAEKLKPGSFIALLMQPTQWKAPERQYTDHVAEMLGRVSCMEIPLEMRFSVPYESQQANAQMVEWAKMNRKCLVLTRELMVWKVA